MNYLKNYKGILALALACTLIFTACKNNGIMPMPSQGNAAGTKLTQYGNDTANIQFGYNLNGSVKQITLVANALPILYNVSYTNGLPTQMTAGNSINQLMFSNGLLQQINLYNLYNNNTLTAQTITTYCYFSNNQLQSQTIHQQAPAGTGQTIKYQYDYLNTDDIGFVSIWLVDNSGNLQLQHTFQCNYDTHPNPLLAVSTFYNQFYGIPASAHNITHLTVFDAHNAVVLTADYSYTYRADGYPVSADRTLLQPGAAAQLDHIKYLYQ